jgi:preprotein translocase subunit YajC
MDKKEMTRKFVTLPEDLIIEDPKKDKKEEKIKEDYDDFKKGDRVIGRSGEKATVINDPEEDGTVQIEWDSGGDVYFSGKEEIERGLKKIKEAEEENSEFGFIKASNLDQLLNDPELHAFFSDPENFDKFVEAMQEFMKTDVLTINKFKEYISNLGFGDKAIDKAIEVLTKEDETDSTDKTEKKTEFIESIKQDMMRTNDPDKLSELYNKLMKDK